MSEHARHPASPAHPRIDIDDPMELARWAHRLGVAEADVISAVIEIGPSSDAVAQHVRTMRDAAG
ncbi:DUF3606 domain-containing protein [Caulobacter endophyticus]|uniref:DUF3606 domain-containing protein n=1 Tax=Caulobacter endophyticus TaxID=2172652 RepID=UPI00240EF8E1|nr:DUF3606 domain-containing protein [Caulobacter endophyticus]MDG2528044.1 DUF3606 domain-containing protein [Caulobacter endophyticus]